MAKTLGKDLRLFVKDTGAATFSQPAGQGNLTINRNVNFIDTSTKDTGAYGTSAPGQKGLTITQAFIPDLPDPKGYTRMKGLDASGDTEVYQVRQKPWADDDVLFECEMYTSFGNTDANRTDPVGSTATLTAADAPTKDDL